MPNLIEYQYPYIYTGYSGAMIYTYYKIVGIQGYPYCRVTVSPGITRNSHYPTVSGSTYFTCYVAFWDGVSVTNPVYNDQTNYWYMRQRSNHIVEEIADEGTACSAWNAWGPLYYWDGADNTKNVITHSYSDNGSEYESSPICSWGYSGGFYPICRARWFSICKYLGYEASVGGYNDIITMAFFHGGYNTDDGAPINPCSNYPSSSAKPCSGFSSGCTHKYPFKSYWSVAKYAKTNLAGTKIGKIEETIFSEYGCVGPFTIYLHTLSGG